MIDPTKLPPAAVRAMALWTYDEYRARAFVEALLADDKLMQRALDVLQERVYTKGPKAWARPNYMRAAITAAVQEP